MKRPVLLDSSFLIALEREAALGEYGPARKFLSSLRERRLVVSVVTVAELLEGATDERGGPGLNAALLDSGLASDSSGTLRSLAAPLGASARTMPGW